MEKEGQIYGGENSRRKCDPVMSCEFPEGTLCPVFSAESHEGLSDLSLTGGSLLPSDLSLTEGSLLPSDLSLTGGSLLPSDLSLTEGSLLPSDLSLTGVSLLPTDLSLSVGAHTDVALSLLELASGLLMTSS
jgi:hypothetical protein